MKNILIFSVAYHPFVGGAEVAVKEITDRLPHITFHMLTVNLDGKQKREEKIGNVYVHRICRGHIGKYFFPFCAARKALSLHKKYHFDATWSLMANYAGFAALFFKYLKPNIPFILTLQEGDPIGYIKRQVWFVYPLFIQIFKKADRMQTISHYLADFGKSMGFKREIHVIPNGVDIKNFTRQFNSRDVALTRKQFGFPEEATILVTSSRLVVKNGISDVILALSNLPENICFVICGNGPLGKEIKMQAELLGVEKRVLFLGFVKHDELPIILAASDIFIRPSITEGLGNSFLEAMAAKKPVIATPVGGIPDFLVDNKTGFMCQPKNPESIVNAVGKITSLSPEMYKEVIDSAYDMVIKKYDWNIVAKDMETKIFK